MMSIDASFSCSAVPHFFSMLCTLSELRVLPHTHTTTTLASYVVKDSASETNFQSIKDLALCCIKWPSGGIHRFLLFGVRRFEKKNLIRVNTIRPGPIIAYYYFTRSFPIWNKSVGSGLWQWTSNDLLIQWYKIIGVVLYEDAIVLFFESDTLKLRIL